MRRDPVAELEDLLSHVRRDLAAAALSAALKTQSSLESMKLVDAGYFAGILGHQTRDDIICSGFREKADGTVAHGHVHPASMIGKQA